MAAARRFSLGNTIGVRSSSKVDLEANVDVDEDVEQSFADDTEMETKLIAENRTSFLSMVLLLGFIFQFRVGRFGGFWLSQKLKKKWYEGMASDREKENRVHRRRSACLSRRVLVGRWIYPIDEPTAKAATTLPVNRSDSQKPLTKLGGITI